METGKSGLLNFFLIFKHETNFIYFLFTSFQLSFCTIQIGTHRTNELVGGDAQPKTSAPDPWK